MKVALRRTPEARYRDVYRGVFYESSPGFYDNASGELERTAATTTTTALARWLLSPRIRGTADGITVRARRIRSVRDCGRRERNSMSTAEYRFRPATEFTGDTRVASAVAL